MTSNLPRPSLDDPWILMATWFGSGYLPKAPGTWGSLAALPFAWVILEHFGPPALLAAVVVVFGVGIVAADRFMAKAGEDDPGAVVIDEVAGQWLTLTLVPLDPLWFALGFVAFRCFDILKPWPIRVLERRFKQGFGVMIDDIAAGALALIVVAVVQTVLA